ncbi:hypothetical protein L198_03410 [Cryptococcus wingfieldii CBS 7118]|uniref:Uncharacterized protein n=1 Tax=Cryptococcus wingfieldii CBS 7118 TaxID=1295528 RepID=A0A1E3JHI1_9TREE|nr:hypothetical protein L198_03410 [Cryptococcus wingfieldii CBS 7118]ODN99566.1 hypothetical protein L198_03410 [Cryptococcus wingfieldii CBS 7118]
MDSTRLPRPASHSSLRPPSTTIPSKLPAPTSSVPPAARLKRPTLSRQPTSAGLRSDGRITVPEPNVKAAIAGTAKETDVIKPGVATGASAQRRLIPSRSTLTLPKTSRLPSPSAICSPPRKPTLTHTKTAAVPLRPAASSNPLGPKRTVSSVASSLSLRSRVDTRKASDGKDVQKAAVRSLGRVGGLQWLRDANMGLSTPAATNSPSRIPSITTNTKTPPSTAATHAYPYTPTNPFFTLPTETPLLPRLRSAASHTSTTLGFTGEAAEDNLMDMDMSFADEDGLGDSLGEWKPERVPEYRRPKFTPRRATPPSTSHIRKCLAESKKELLGAKKERDELAGRVEELQKEKMKKSWRDVAQEGELELEEVRQAIKLIQRLRVEHGL